MDWLVDNRELLSLLANLGMLVVWITYLQVFISSYRRQNKPKILINLGGGRELDARCLVSNMSADPIYVQSIIAKLHTADREIACPVTELDGVEDWEEPSDLRLWSRQGPLGAGNVRDMGSLRSIFDHVLRRKSPNEDPSAVQQELISFELQVAAVYGSEDLLVGAKRQFKVRSKDDQVCVQPLTVDAKQIRSRRERKEISRLLEQEL
ncbi:hypothetical protein [Devosia sp. RR2S18]|uniref:hypothetical protein n=1 Tax=Devosia rhizosphaerae TaxID=3049774 RepID=UPI0025403A08|nr:hypothetical protein [Devosia sp. RR2S18]WIJ24275.1 hypothetical protein QOV41_14805 [Devosia sp. RR2S18]